MCWTTIYSDGCFFPRSFPQEVCKSAAVGETKKKKSFSLTSAKQWSACLRRGERGSSPGTCPLTQRHRKQQRNEPTNNRRDIEKTKKQQHLNHLDMTLKVFMTVIFEAAGKNKQFAFLRCFLFCISLLIAGESHRRPRMQQSSLFRVRLAQLGAPLCRLQALPFSVGNKKRHQRGREITKEKAPLIHLAFI